MDFLSNEGSPIATVLHINLTFIFSQSLFMRSSKGKTMLFDTHLHLIYLKRLTYPWLKDVPELNTPNELDTYTQSARRLGISGCFNMEVDVAPAQIDQETALVTELMADPNSLLKGAISSCRPEEDSFADFLERALANPTVRGLRRVLHVMPDETSQSPLFRENIKRLSNTKLTFDLCVLPAQMLLANQLVDHCPDVQFILDHCGTPDIKGADFEQWSSGITELAKRPNVVAKISGVIAYADPETWSLETLRPYIDHTVSAFGHDRVVWGSDSPVCNLGGDLATWVATTRALTQNWLPDDRDALFSRNAARIWGL
jgi:predicted TIM-barrel fold metal-dependent hydrolase